MLCYSPGVQAGDANEENDEGWTFSQISLNVDCLSTFIFIFIFLFLFFDALSTEKYVNAIGN